MKSKNRLEKREEIKSGFQKIQLFFKRFHFQNLISFLHKFSAKLYKYTGRQHHRSTLWLLCADQYVPDDRKAPLKQDLEVKSHSSHWQSWRKDRTSMKSLHRFSSKDSTFKKQSIMRNSSQMRLLGKSNNPTPLSTLQNSVIDIEEDSQIISNFRQQKTRREEYKNKIMEAQRKKVFRLIDKNLTNIAVNPAKKLKKEKLHQVDHYISMDVTFREPQEASDNIQKPKKPLQQQAYKNKNSKTERIAKTSNQTFRNRQFEELKPEQKIYLLNVPNELKLNNGVTFRQNQRHGHNMQNLTNNLNRKKLQFLKNDELNPIKIKISQLASYKKITTTTNLNYCSSMKTVKQLPKDGPQSKVSIDSKQLLDQPSGSKKLIKIANRRIYEQLLIDLCEQGQEINLRKTRLKPRKQGKVHFDNVAS